MANVKEWIIVVHPNGKENKGQTKGEAFKSFVESKTGKDYRQNTSYEEITAKTKELENKYNSELPFAGGILDKKEYVEEYSFSGSKFTNEEADIYYLKECDTCEGRALTKSINSILDTIENK